MAEKKTVPVRPKTSSGSGKTVVTRPTSKGPATSSKSSSSSKASSKSKTTPESRARADAKAAEKRAVARANADKKKAGQRYLENAANLELQAKAIKDALNVEFARGRDQNLSDLDKVLTQQLNTLKEGAQLRGMQFLKQAEDTEGATAGVAESGISNLVRERSDSLNAVLEHGAGETDAMRAMLMSARNWHANAQENNRSYFDTMNSVNNSIVDLNIDTKTGLSNAANQAESERERIWQDYYNRRSEAYTQYGNIKGQQAEYFAQAKEMGVKPKKGEEAAAEKAMKEAFQNAADESGKSYVNQGLPEWIQEYKGTEQVQARQSNTNLAAAIEFQPVKKAEGATLRKWAS
jgi:uncharacterized protein YdaT